MGSRKHRERVRESKFIGPLFTQEYLARLTCGPFLEAPCFSGCHAPACVSRQQRALSAPAAFAHWCQAERGKKKKWSHFTYGPGRWGFGKSDSGSVKRWLADFRVGKNTRPRPSLSNAKLERPSNKQMEAIWEINDYLPISTQREASGG